MSIVQFNNVSKSYLDEQILKNISFSIENNDSIGLIGLNGVGKSTIVRLLLNLERADSGEIFVDKNICIANISQTPDFENFENTILEELNNVFKEEIKAYKRIQELNSLVLFNESYKKELDDLNNFFISKDGYNIEYRVNQVIMGLELNDIKNNSISSLSGGEKTRLALAKLLLQEPDLLILDEPTNHLDLISIEWLEEFLKKYKKAFLLISHDRVFLDNVCNRIFEIENKQIYKYKGNFNDFVIQKEMILKDEIKAFEKEQERIKKLNEYIERNRAGRMAKQAKGRQKLLDRIVRKDNPLFDNKKMKLTFEINNSSADKVLEVKNISKSFNDKNILKNISFNIFKGEKIGIIGKNGCGKSTLLKIIQGLVPCNNGDILFGNRVNTAYYDQNHENLYPENTILQEINTSINYTNEHLRSLAASFLFSDESVDKKIKNLSGGEKVRVSLIKLTQQNANFLILDEPTNHLDIYSIEILENALEAFEGTLLLVSHNRHFIDSVCDSIYILNDDGLKHFKGNYTEYKESLKENKNIKKEDTKKNDYIEQKEKSRKINKIKKDIQNVETRLESIEKEKKNLENSMFDNNVYNNVEKLMNIQDCINKLDTEEIELMEIWENLNNELNQIE